MVNEYVNAAAEGSGEKKRGNSGTQVVAMVGISFGLLCVLQAVLNICLRLQSVQPLQDLLQENKEMKENISQLVQRNQELQDKNKDLTDKLATVVNTMTDLKGLCGDPAIVPPRCAKGWTRYRSSCYQISKTTHTWDHARQDCRQKGAHLVIINDQEEEAVLYQFEGYNETWLGLRAKNNTFNPSAWTWVDGTRPTYNQWNGDVSNTSKRCVFLQKGFLLQNWMQDDCSSLHHWMCERELSSSKPLPK